MHGACPQQGLRFRREFKHAKARTLFGAPDTAQPAAHFSCTGRRTGDRGHGRL